MGRPQLGRSGSRDRDLGGRAARRSADSVADMERRSAQERMFALDLDKVLKGDALRYASAGTGSRNLALCAFCSLYCEFATIVVGQFSCPKLGARYMRVLGQSASTDAQARTRGRRS